MAQEVTLEAIRRHMENKQRPWKCRFCPRTFKYKFCLVDHARKFHEPMVIEIQRQKNIQMIRRRDVQELKQRPSVIVHGPTLIATALARHRQMITS